VKALERQDGLAVQEPVSLPVASVNPTTIHTARGANHPRLKGEPNESSWRCQADGWVEEENNQRRRGHASRRFPASIWLNPATRTAEFQDSLALNLAPRDARIVGLGFHPILPMMAVVWVSVGNQLIVTIDAGEWEAATEVLVRVWSIKSPLTCRTTILKVCGGRARGDVSFGLWDGHQVAGVTMLNVTQGGEEW
jgi:hypothetical protein